jgi:hypothetical protein
MARGKEPPAPIMRAGASLHSNHRRRQFFDCPHQFAATDLPRDDHAIAVDAVDVELLLPKINCK